MKIFKFFLITFVICQGLSSLKIADDKPEVFEFFQGTYDEMIREAKKQKKTVILDFWAVWCGPCIKLDKETFSNKKLGNYLSQNYIVYKVDVDTFDGKEIVNRFAIDVLPTIVVFDPKNGQLGKFKGYYPAGYLQKELEKIHSQKSIHAVSVHDGLGSNKYY